MHESTICIMANHTCMYDLAAIVCLTKLEHSLTLLRFGWWKLVSSLLLMQMEPDAYETMLMDEYFAGVNDALFVFL